MSAGTVIWLARAELRLHDQPALLRSLSEARTHGMPWLALWWPPRQHDTAWGFPRMSERRRAWWNTAASALAAMLERAGHALWQTAPGHELVDLLMALPRPWRIHTIDQPAPEEQRDLQALRQLGATVITHGHNTLLEAADLPFQTSDLPDVFTIFRQRLQRHGTPVRAPLPAPTDWPPPLPPTELTRLKRVAVRVCARSAPTAAALRLDPRHSLPVDAALPDPWAGEAAALTHLKRWCASAAPHTYKATRNALSDAQASSHWSLWLATGALSPRQAWAQVDVLQRDRGASEGIQWLLFELLWRDHFRFLHLKYGRALYRARGLAQHAPERPFDRARFAAWTQGRTDCALVDAAMHELAATGKLSNRLRQIAASYWLHELAGDWRVGAAWFEHHLLDYDPCSNTGNWLYIAGLGTDPRGGRHFNPAKQTAEHDPLGIYRRRWLTPLPHESTDRFTG